MAKKIKKAKTEKVSEKPAESKAEAERGRPSDYDPTYVQMLLDYFSTEPYREVEKTLITKKGEKLTVYEDRANDFPTLAGFAIKIGVHRDTLLEWSKVHPDFSGAYKRAKDFQENYLVINGNKGLINPAFGIFTAKNVIGYRDKLDGEQDQVNVNVTNVQSIPEKELDAKIEEKMKKIKGGKD